MFFTCASMARSYDSKATPRTASSSCARVKTRPGSRASVVSSWNSVELTPTEFQLLTTLAREPGRVFTRAQLLDAVRGVAFESYERAIDAHVKNIRRKLEPEPAAPRYLLTVYGVGYRFAELEE